jgi:hypothetical protein
MKAWLPTSLSACPSDRSRRTGSHSPRAFLKRVDVEQVLSRSVRAAGPDPSRDYEQFRCGMSCGVNRRERREPLPGQNVARTGRTPLLQGSTFSSLVASRPQAFVTSRGMLWGAATTPPRCVHISLSPDLARPRMNEVSMPSNSGEASTSISVSVSTGQSISAPCCASPRHALVDSRPCRRGAPVDRTALIRLLPFQPCWG